MEDQTTLSAQREWDDSVFAEGSAGKEEEGSPKPGVGIFVHALTGNVVHQYYQKSKEQSRKNLLPSSSQRTHSQFWILKLQILLVIVANENKLASRWRCSNFQWTEGH